uniref:Uncharacterized protein n=1 Tax=Pundamilia nyererei TaxID=303518 RepID=A0A3B4G7V0_9CICH
REERGGGRRGRMLSFTMETVKGDAPPPSVQQPTPVFPVMERKPLPLTGGEEAEYLLALKQDFRGAMRSLPCFIQPLVTHRDVERYSDKYNRSEQMDKLLDWAPGEAPPTAIHSSSKRSYYTVIQWGKKVFSQPPIVQVPPPKMMTEVS